MSNEKAALSMDEVRQVSDSLREKNAIRRVFVFLDGEDLVVFLRRAVVAEWILGRLPQAGAMVAYRAAAGRETIVACAPSLAVSLVADPDAAAVIPVDWFDIGNAAPVRCDDPGWQRNGWSKADLVLLPGMLSPPPGLIDGLAEAPPRLRLPRDFAAGAPPRGDRTVCIDTDLDPPDSNLAARLGAELGGLVVPLAGCEGSDRSVRALVADIAGARLVVSATPLHLCLASAFGVPCVGVGLDRPEDCLWNRGDIVLAGADPDRILAASVRRAAASPLAPDKPAAPDGTVSLPLSIRARSLLDFPE